MPGHLSHKWRLIVKKAQLKVEETRLEATLEAIQQEKEAEAAFAEATVLEAAMDSAGMTELAGDHDIDQGSSNHLVERTEKYVQEQYAYVNANQPSDEPQPETKVDSTPSAVGNLKPSGDSPLHHKPHSRRERQCLTLQATTPIEAVSSSKRPLVHFTPKRELMVAQRQYRG